MAQLHTHYTCTSHAGSVTAVLTAVAAAVLTMVAPPSKAREAFDAFRFCLPAPLPCVFTGPDFQNGLFGAPSPKWVTPVQNHRCPSNEVPPDPECLRAGSQAGDTLVSPVPPPPPCVPSPGAAKRGKVGAGVSELLTVCDRGSTQESAWGGQNKTLRGAKRNQ